MKVTWKHHYNEDGSKRRVPPSTIHGWIAKWRGTFFGNEETRSKGIKEMQEAARRRRARNKYDAKRKNSNMVGLLSLFRPHKPPTRRLTRAAVRRAPRPSGHSRQTSRHHSSQRVPARRLTTTRKHSTQSASRAQNPPPARPQLRPHQSSSRRVAHGQNRR